LVTLLSYTKDSRRNKTTEHHQEKYNLQNRVRRNREKNQLTRRYHYGVRKLFTRAVSNKGATPRDIIRKKYVDRLTEQRKDGLCFLG
jgi:hypothetical protein